MQLPAALNSKGTTASQSSPSKLLPRIIYAFPHFIELILMHKITLKVRSQKAYKYKRKDTQITEVTITLMFI